MKRLSETVENVEKYLAEKSCYAQNINIFLT